jgi:hypothetical protein
MKVVRAGSAASTIIAVAELGNASFRFCEPSRSDRFENTRRLVLPCLNFFFICNTDLENGNHYAAPLRIPRAVELLGSSHTSGFISRRLAYLCSIGVLSLSLGLSVRERLQCERLRFFSQATEMGVGLLHLLLRCCSRPTVKFGDRYRHALGLGILTKSRMSSLSVQGRTALAQPLHGRISF